MSTMQEEQNNDAFRPISTFLNVPRFLVPARMSREVVFICFFLRPLVNFVVREST